MSVPPAARRKRDHLTAVFGFLAALVRTRPHVVQLELPWPRFAPGQLLSCALLALPTVVVFQLVPADVESVRQQLARRGWMFRAAQRRQTWIAVSEYARATVGRLFDVPGESVGRVYNGVDLEKYNESPNGSRAAVRASLGFGDAETVILSAGRLAEQKCFADLLAAFAQVADRRPEARLLIAGEGPERPTLEQLLRSLGLEDRARLLGNVADLPPLYGAADLFVLPSRYEGFPFALLEAMAAARPVVATRFGGADELVDDGVDGRLVPVGDVAAVAAAIEDVLSSRERMSSMAASARRKAEQFSKTRMIDETLAVLERTALSPRLQLLSGLRARA